MNIHERINKEVADQPDWTADQIAERIQRFCSKQDYWPLLISAIENRQRGHTRSLEAQRFASLMAAFQPEPILLPSVPTVSLEDLRPLLNRRIGLGDGTATTWALATVDDHQKRLAMLIAQRNGISVTIRRHEEAIRLLQQAGVSCLADLAQARAAA